MKLAEALNRRAFLQKEVTMLESQLRHGAKIVKGSTPEVSTMAVLGEIENCLQEIEYITMCVNKTNMQTVTPSGKTVTELIATRDRLTKQITAYRKLQDALVENDHRYSHSEVEYVNSCKIKDIRAKINQSAKELRITEAAILLANSTVDLME